MNRLLQEDYKDFEREFRDAAHLCYEALVLCRSKLILNDQDINRLKELKQCPACQMEWFKELIKL